MDPESKAERAEMAQPRDRREHQEELGQVEQTGLKEGHHGSPAKVLSFHRKLTGWRILGMITGAP
jgi:hypothetical protein